MVSENPVKINRSRARTEDLYLLSSSQLKTMISEGVLPDWLK